MTIAGNAHVQINGINYLLDESQQDHYVHSFPGLFPHFFTYENIQGSATGKNVQLKRLLWETGDWVGGEGNNIFYDDQPNVYDYSVVTNPRIAGQFTARPKRDRSTATITSTTSTTAGHYARFFDARGNLFLYVDNKVYYGDGSQATGWTGVSPTLPTSHGITAMCGDTEMIYGSSWKDGGAVSNDRLTFYSPDGGSTWRNMLTTEAVSGASTVQATSNGYFGMTVHAGRLLAWTGRKLMQFDVQNLATTNSLSADQYRKVYDTGSEPGSSAFGNSAWADIIDCGTSACFFVSAPGRTQVYQYKQGVARPIWTKPGFTAKSIAYNSGLLYISGTFSAGSSGGTPGHGAEYAIPLNNLSEIFLKWVRKTVDSNLQMQVAEGSFGNQVIWCAAHTGRMWVYDLDYDSMTMLDDLAGNDGTSQELTNELGSNLAFTANDHRIGDTYSFGKYRVFSIYRPGTTGETAVQVLHYSNDMQAQRMTTATSMNWFMCSPEHDFLYPNDVKLLLGFHVSFTAEGATTSGLLANQRIRIQYALDKGQNPSWTTAGTITSSTALPTGGAIGRTFIDLSASNLKFLRLRWRALIDNNNTAGVQPPIVLDVVAEAELLAYDETYDLILRIKDMDPKTRTSAKQVKANIMRDTLVTARKAKNLVDFYDGYLYREEGRKAAKQRVFIDAIEDHIDRNAEGTMKVSLRVVPI